MSIDLEKALGAELAPTSGSWSRDDVILYHLGIGAGVGKATDPKAPVSEEQSLTEGQLAVMKHICQGCGPWGGAITNFKDVSAHVAALKKTQLEKLVVKCTNLSLAAAKRLSTEKAVTQTLAYLKKQL